MKFGFSVIQFLPPRARAAGGQESGATELTSGHREAQKCDIFLSGLAPGHKSESAVLTGVPVIPSGCGYTAWCMGNTETAGLEWSKCTIWTRKLIPDW